jgi:hypothetical protein
MLSDIRLYRRAVASVNCPPPLAERAEADDLGERTVKTVLSSVKEAAATTATTAPSTLAERRAA